MPAFKITQIGLLFCFISLALGSKCPQDSISKLVVCYYKVETSLANLNICNCTHLVFTTGVKRAENNSISASEETIKLLEIVKERKENLSLLFTFETKQEETWPILKSENKSRELVDGIVEFLLESDFDGLELNFKFTSDDGVSKESYASFVKSLSKELSSKHRRVKRNGYDVFEKVTDDFTTASYTTQTPKNSTSKAQSIKEKKPKEKNRKIREEKTEERDDEEEDEENVDYETLEEAINAKFAEEKTERQNTLEDVEEENFEEKKFLVFVRLSTKPEIVAKKYDLKALSRYADILTVPTHSIVNSNEDHVTYHPSRLMGLSDILNTDSILDFLTGMGALKSKMVITLPATVLKFQLKDEKKNTPRSPAISEPQVIDQSQLCSLFNKNNWTIERDDDLTAPYAFSEKTWLAFEDEISVNIKGKYILLRELAGGGIYPIDADVNDGLCTNRTGTGGYLSGVLHKNFESLERKPRALVLESLQEEIHDNAYTNLEAGVKLSEYRIVRVVDHLGAVHVIRKNTKTQFECSRQGYFSHPLGCNKFYRCVKFDQYSDEFTVFEYDCPAGLAFDERWEVCVWPGSLPHGAPCTGSSEIAPVPRSHYQCPNQEGYYPDPENCRWFFACLDHARDGITPLTAYEFRCPFGLVFSQEKLACDWPWLVGTCGNKGAAGYLQVNAAGQSQGFHSATFINGGNLQASLGQYGNTDEEAAFIGFGKKFGSGLKGAAAYSTQNGYQGAQSAGFGYIANQFDTHHDRASFAAFPEYQISGGRILNKGGVVLDQNVARVASGGAVGFSGITAVGIDGLSRIGASRGLGTVQKEISHFDSTSSVNFQTQEPTLQTNTLKISGINIGQATFQSPVSTPKPFSVNIPSVQINAEKISEYSGHPTTPQTLLFKQTPQTEHIRLTGKNSESFTVGQPTFSAGIPTVTPTVGTFKEAISVGAGTFSSPSGFLDGSTPKPPTHGSEQNQFTNRISGKNSQRFTVSQPTYSVGISAVTPTTETHTFGEVISGEAGASHFSTPSVSVSVSSPKPETFGFGQNEFINRISEKGSQGYTVSEPTFSVGIPAVTPTVATHTIGKVNSAGAGASQFSTSSFSSQKPELHRFELNHFTNTVTGKSSQGFTVNQPTYSTGIPAVTPATAIHTFKDVISGGVGTSHFTPSVSFSSSPKPEIHRFGQNQFTNRVNQASVTVGHPDIIGTEFYKHTSGFPGGQAIPAVTSNQGVASFEYKSSGLGGSLSQFSSTPGSAIAGFIQNHRISGEKDLGKPAIATIQTNIQKEQNVVPGNIVSGISYGAPAATPTPSVYTSQSHFSGSTPTSFVHSTIDDKVTNEIKFNSPSSSFANPIVTPKTEFHTFSKISSGLNANKVSNKIPLPTGKPEYQVLHTSKSSPSNSYGVPAVLQSDFKFYEGNTGDVAVTATVPFDAPAGSFGHAVVKEFTETTVPHSNLNAFQQTNSFKEKGISQTSYSFPVGVSQTFISPKTELKVSQPTAAPAFGQRYSYSSTGNKFGTIQPFAEISSTQAPPIIQKTTVITPKIEQPHVSTGVSIQQQPVVSVATLGSQFVTIQPFGSVSSTPSPAVAQKTNVLLPKTEGSHVLTGVSFQQPIVAIGTVGATSDEKFSIPSTHSNALPHNPLVSHVNLKSSYVQPQHVTVTTPAPVVSLTPSAPIELNQPSLQSYEKSIIRSQEKVETSGPALLQTVVTASGNAIFNQKSSGQQEIKSFTPVVTTAAPSYGEEIASTFGAKTSFFGQTNTYRPLVTPKTEIFGSSPQQLTEEYGSTLQQSTGHFGINEKNQIFVKKEPINQGFDFFKIKPLEEKRTEFIQQVGTAVPSYQQSVVTPTSNPQEKLIELEIAKSVEINPAVIPKTIGVSPSPIVIQQQPVHLISEKTYRFKPGVQQVYKQEKETVQTQINSVPQQQYAFRQEIETPIIQQQKQYVQPIVTPKPVSFTTIKTINIQQPTVDPTHSTFGASRVPFTTQTESTFVKGHSSPSGFIETSDFIDHFDNQGRQEVVSSKVNLLLPTVTELPRLRYTPEELSLQTHQSFDSQKIKFGSRPVQNVFIQPEVTSTVKPSVFDTSEHFFQYNRAQNFTNEHSVFGSGIRYSINPNIAIPEPPKEYILAQNAYTTVAPEIVTTGQRSTESASGASTTYLPPQVESRRKSSKTTVISVSNLNEEDGRDDNIQQIVEKYSGRFGQVIKGRNGKVVTKVIKGEGRGQIEVDRQGSSTVQYEVSSTTPGPRGRARQYHGVITSGLQATNKYEEYDIDGSQRSFDSGTTSQDKSDVSKTTLDLKNLKLEKDKKTVIVVSQVSDANPVLIGKLAGQCSCQSNMIELRGKGKKGSLRRKNKNQHLQATITNEYLPPFESNPALQIASQGEATTASPESVIIDGSKLFSYATDKNFVSSSTTAPDVISSTILSSLGTNGVLSITPKTLYDDKLGRKKQYRGRARFLPPIISDDGSSVLAPVPASEIASTVDYSILKGDESRTQNEIEGGRKTLAGAAFDRYGPGGWRSFDETLQGSIDCKRPGLFRHPKHCNKFYACNYDPWEERYTLHVFNCPIQLTYDSSISACNWPVRGPACADDNLLV